MPLGAAKRLCPGLLVVPCDHVKYGEVSGRIMETLETFTPDLEPASIDEAYLDGTAVARRHGGAERLARAVKEAVLREVGLTCSAGVAPNKLLAKLASGMRKPDGLTVLAPGAVPALLEGLKVGELCGIGPATVAALGSLGVGTCGQLGRYPLEALVGRFGSMGGALLRMGRGEDDSPVRRADEKEEAKSIGHAETFDEDLSDRGRMEEILLRLAAKVGRRARSAGASGRRVTLTVRYADFTTFTRQSTLPSPIATDAAIAGEARGILRPLSLSQPVRLLGVTLGELTYGGGQADLFPADDRPLRVQDALDRINDRFGDGCIRPAGIAPQRTKPK
jgi:DNA polymerase-4